MLFSDPKVANYINENFARTWESVRPVPIVNIDFGSGTKITRTLHGNIASYVCNADGMVVDILPGLYEPGTYIKRLDELRLEALNLAGNPNLKDALQKYHGRQFSSMLEKGFFQFYIVDGAKRVIERPVEDVISQYVSIELKSIESFLKANNSKNGSAKSGLNQLVEDTITNEITRRNEIHQQLSMSEPVQPKEITKWLYKNVLHADLEDPYLGLGPMLFSTYPFKDDIPKGNDSI